VNRTKQNDEIVQRIEYIRNYLGLNKSRFSTEIGLKPQTYNNFIGAQASKPSVDLVVGIVNRFGVNPGWILTGSGPVFSERSAERESGTVPPGMAPARRASWGEQAAESATPGGLRADTEGELHQKIARLENIVRSIESRVDSIAGSVPGLRELNEKLARLYGTDPEAARKQLLDIEARLGRMLKERDADR